MIFTACNDPFATGDTEARRYAVFSVRVARVRFEAARGLIIPKTYGTIMCSG